MLLCPKSRFNKREETPSSYSFQPPCYRVRVHLDAPCVSNVGIMLAGYGRVLTGYVT